jgi:DNA-binding MarR family transcriptional regulator
MVNVKNCLFFDRPISVILNLYSNGGKKVYSSSVARDLGMAYAYTLIMLRQFEKGGLVNFEKNGRIGLVTLTKKGIKVAKGLTNLSLIFKGMKPTEEIEKFPDDEEGTVVEEIE